MNVLILGSGGREHAIGWKIAQSSLLNSLYFAPGNPGTTDLGTNIDLDPTDVEAVKEAIRTHDIKYLVIGPEKPLVEGLHDAIMEDPDMSEVTVIGPKKEGAKLEGSKAFSKAFMLKHDIPTAAYRAFSANELEEAKKFLKEINAPYVLKADGLAAGKGVVIHEDLQEAERELEEMLRDKKFGEASGTVVIEEFMDGVELSVFVITDGDSYKILPDAKDYKRVGEGDTGLNTGGMGAISPVPFADRDLLQKVEERIIAPTIKGMKEDGIPYQGFLYFGLMKVGNDPYVVEYNVRMGDPECQAVLPRVSSDLLDIFEGIDTNTLSERDLEVDPRSAATVVLASGGYPGSYEKGKTITGIQDVTDCYVFHAGTKLENGKLVTNGGRVLAVTCKGRDLETALSGSLKGADKIQFGKKYYRRDIGKDVMKKWEKA